MGNSLQTVVDVVEVEGKLIVVLVATVLLNRWYLIKSTANTVKNLVPSSRRKRGGKNRGGGGSSEGGSFSDNSNSFPVGVCCSKQPSHPLSSFLSLSLTNTTNQSTHRNMVNEMKKKKK